MDNSTKIERALKYRGGGEERKKRSNTKTVGKRKIRKGGRELRGRWIGGTKEGGTIKERKGTTKG